jgi:hypothetical protein
MFLHVFLSTYKSTRVVKHLRSRKQISRGNYIISRTHFALPILKYQRVCFLWSHVIMDITPTEILNRN